MYLSYITIYNPSPVTSIYMQSVSLQCDNIKIYNAIGTSYPEQGGGITCLNCNELYLHSGVFVGLRG